MRTYVVQAGDSPAMIAARFAGCPKCAVDLVSANPQKPAVRYPNGFLTFQSLTAGERLNLPDKWSNGALDTLPQSYFDALPAMPGRPRYAVSEGTKSRTVFGIGAPPDTIDVPSSKIVQMPDATFLPQQNYTLTVWPIPQPNNTSPDPTQVLTDLQFAVLNVTSNTDGSSTIDVTFIGVNAFTLTGSTGIDTLIIEDAGPFITPTFSAGVLTVNPPVTVPAGVVYINPPAGGVWVSPNAWTGSALPGQHLNTTGLGTNAIKVKLFSGTVTLAGVGQMPPLVGGPIVAMTVDVTGFSGGSAFQVGETIQGLNSGATAVVGVEYEIGSSSAIPSGDGTLTLSQISGQFTIGEPIQGQTSGSIATLKYHYGHILASVNGLLGVTSAVGQGSVPQQLPFTVQASETVVLSVQPMLNNTGIMTDPTEIFSLYGFTTTAPAVQDPSDCSWTLTGVNNTGGPLTIDSPMNDFNTNAAMIVKSLTVNGSVILLPLAPAQQIGGPIMTACHAYTLSFIPKACPALLVGTYDPTVGLAQLGLTNFTLNPNGPDELGQYSVDGVWELGDGFQLPTSPFLTLTDFTDNGPATNVATGNCATSLPYTLQPGDTVNLIVRPVGVPGQPMSNPLAVLTALGFTNVAPAATYSDCTWSVTATYSGASPLQITDPLISPGFGAMWIVGMSVNSTTIKNANWAGLTEITLALNQCNAYSILFTFDTCPALTGAPGSWDPSAAVQAILPGFKVAPGPNEYGEWTASGVWTGASVQALAGAGGMHFTFLVDFGPSQGCTVTPPGCPTGQIADTITKACVAPCMDGSAPANGVCPPPVKATGPCPTGQVRDTQTGVCVAACPGGGAPSNGVCPVVAPAASTTSTGTVVAVGAAVVLLGGAAYLALA